MASYQTRVYFRVAINTSFGQKVRVVGGCPKLGSWNPKKALSLTTTDEVFPVWFSREPVYLPLQVPIYYQYVVLSDLTGEVVTWDTHQESRKIVPTGYEMTVEDDEGLYRALTRGGAIHPPKTLASHSRSNLRSPIFRAEEPGRKATAELLPRPDTPPTAKHAGSLASYLSVDARPVSSPDDSSPPLDGGRFVSSSSLAEVDEPLATETSGTDVLEAIRKLREIEGEPTMNADDTIVIVSLELPVSIVRRRSDGQQPCCESDYEVVKSNALLIPGLHRVRKSFGCQMKFVGLAGVTTVHEEEKDIIRRLLEPYDCFPVFPSAEELEVFVNFCHKFLSPLFHSVVDFDCRSQEPFNSHAWLVYQSMSKIWASEAVIHFNSESDIVWVHDFHLLLVPQYVSRRYKRANIGLFLHVPFPSSELFRCLPVRGEILRGMLCADLVGFHFFEYARHFLVSNKRLLGLDHQFTLGGFLGIEYGGRNVMLKISHVNVEYKELQSMLAERLDIRQAALSLRQRFADKFVFGAVDRCDQLAGLILKLRGFHYFLSNFPYARNKVVLVQYAYPTRGSVRDATKMANELTMMSNMINAEFGPAIHVDLRIQPVSPEEKYAILQAADCLLDTSVRDGLNLLAFEYIGSRQDKASHMILSEFTGCSMTIASALRINPWQLEDVANAMDRVVNTQPQSLAEKWARDKLYLSQHSLSRWVQEFVSDLRRARKQSSKVYMQCGFASTFRVLSMDGSFRPLNIPDVVKAYRGAKRRMLFFDHEGTLAPDRRHLAVVANNEDHLSATGTPPSLAVKSALETLARDSNNIVVILSGRDQKCLEDWFGDLPDIGLCAEHGFYAKIPSVTGTQWTCMSDTIDFTWKQVAMELMLQYTKRTQGAFIENKGSALVFQYRDADPDFGSWQAKELASYLEEFLFGQPVSVITGKGYVEAKLRGVSKGVALEHVLLSTSAVFGNPHFVLCVGDDRTDEDMFQVVNALDNDPPKGRPRPMSRSNLLQLSSVSSSGESEVSVYSVTVGKKPSQAKWFVNDTEEVSELLNALKAQTTDGMTLDANTIVGGILRASSSKDDSDYENEMIRHSPETFWPGAELALAPIVDADNARKSHAQLLEHLCHTQ